MYSQKLTNILILVVLFMAIFQVPIIYYYTFGFLALFITIPYLIIGCGLTIFLLVKVLKSRKNNKYQLQLLGLIITIIIGTTSLFVGEDLVESLDWNLRKDTRLEIIEKVREGELKPNVGYNNIMCSLSDWNFPPISNGGNEIYIDKRTSGLTVMFYINRGFLDHYSAFVFTDDPVEIPELEKRIRSKNGGHKNVKLEKNWYRVSY